MIREQKQKQKIELPDFNIPLATVEDINKILNNLNVKKSPGPGLLLPELVKLVANIIDEPLKEIINEIITETIFPDIAKIAHVTPRFKTDKKDRQDKGNYRPISGIGTFSKIIERYIETKVTEYVESFLSIFISAYRKKYSTNNVLIRLIET